MSARSVSRIGVVLVAALALVLPALSAAGGCGKKLTGYDWNDHNGDYKQWSHKELTSAFGGGGSRPDFRGKSQKVGVIYSRGMERASVGNGHLRVKMPANGVGTRGSGLIFTVRLPEEVDEGTLNYKVKFDENYAGDGWTLGGKLPGLADEDMASGCRSSDVSGTGSFVARTMWRSGGQLVSYMYITPDKQTCVNGEDWPYKKSAKAGSWMRISMYIKLNDPGKKNGLHKVWIDGQKVYSRDDVYYRSKPGHGIAKFKMDVFHGGSDGRFSPKRDQYIYFDDISVHSGFCVDGASSSESKSPGGSPAPSAYAETDAGLDGGSEEIDDDEDDDDKDLQDHLDELGVDEDEDADEEAGAEKDADEEEMDDNGDGGSDVVEEDYGMDDEEDGDAGVAGRSKLTTKKRGAVKQSGGRGKLTRKGKKSKKGKGKRPTKGKGKKSKKSRGRKSTRDRVPRKSKNRSRRSKKRRSTFVEED